MPRPYDAITKALIESRPGDWLPLLGFTGDAVVDVVDSDLPAATSQADRVLRVGSKWLLHLELQSSRDPSLPKRMLRYNVLLHDRHEMPVHSAAVLLRPEADSPSLSGEYQSASPLGGALRFDYQVVRIWRMEPEALLAGGIGLTPFAMIGAVQPEELPEIRAALERRFERDLDTAARNDYWSAIAVLMGLRWSAALTRHVLKGVRAMKESVVYQEILAEGEARGEVKGEAKGRAAGRVEGRFEGATYEARRVALRLGEARFGPASAEIVMRLDAIQNLERLEQLHIRALTATNWDDLLK